MPTTGPKVVVIGGGTGTFTVLSALKYYAHDITAIVNMVDDGGSTGLLRDEMGVLPPGDARQSLVALSESSQELRDLFNYRFPEGAFAGHSFGNLFMASLEKTTGSFADAIRVAGEVLAIQGRVLPATTDDIRLVLETNGRTVRGEDQIGEGPENDRLFVKGQPHRLYLEPSAKIYEGARRAILDADVIVISPGKLYSSILPSFLIEGMSETLREAKGKKVYICNLMTQPTQTDGFSVTDFAAEIERYAGGPILDYVIFNTASPSKDLVERYAKEGEQPVVAEANALSHQKYQPIGADLVSKAVYKPHPNDKLLKRTLIRHDSDTLARLIMRIYFS